MYHIHGVPKQKCRLLAVLCGKAVDKQSNGAETVSYGHLEIQTLINPTLDIFRDAQKLFDPTFLCFQGEQLEDKEEIGSLVWGTLDVSDPQMLSSAIGASLPDTVYLEVPNGENIAHALQSKGVPHVIYWKGSFSSNAASHFRQALLSVLQSSCSHTWDAFQLAHASFRLYCVRNDNVLPVNIKKNTGKLGPCLLGDAPKIEIPPVTKAPGEEENLPDTFPVVKIYDDDVVVRFLVCGVPCTLDACLLGSLEDGLGALLNIEIRRSKLHYRVSATPPPLQDEALSHGVVTMRCDLITGSAACVSVLVSCSSQTFSNDQILDLIKNELMEKSHLVRALPSCEESNHPMVEPVNSLSVACGASLFEVCMKVPNWAAQVLKHLASAVSYRNFVTLGIASIQGLPVCSFEKDDAKYLSSICTREGQEKCNQDDFLFALPFWSSPVRRKRPQLGPEIGPADYNNMVGENAVAWLNYDQAGNKGVRLIVGQKLKVAALKPIPHSRQPRMLCSRSKPNLPLIRTPVEHNSAPRAPATIRKSMSSSSRAQQIVPLNPLPTKKHECKRSSIKVCSEEEFLKDVMQFLIIEGHHWLVPQRRISEFPDALLNGRRLDLYNLYREVVSSGGFSVGNDINWKGKVFPMMRNHTATNRNTGVTNALKRHYETYLLDYELAHDDVGGDCCLLCNSSTPGDWVNCALCSEWAHFGCERRQGLGDFKDYVKTDGLEYICPHCSLRNMKRKSQKL